jgi:hypothetical protein
VILETGVKRYVDQKNRLDGRTIFSDEFLCDAVTFLSTSGVHVAVAAGLDVARFPRERDPRAMTAPSVMISEARETYLQ